MAVIGVLDLQGAVEEHIKQIQRSGHEAARIKKPDQLQHIDGLILPGGESTVIGKLMARYGFVEAVRNFSEQEKPILGTCAGLVLMADEMNGTEKAHLALIDICAVRNGFGRQINSFEADLQVKGINEPVRAVFIRAPYIQEAGPDVEVLASYQGKIVAARKEHLIVSSFHPELTEDAAFLTLFFEMAEDKKHVNQAESSLPF